KPIVFNAGGKCRSCCRSKRLAILMARTALMAAPTINRICLAGYTQRKRASSATIGDAYVYVLEFSREQLAAVESDTVDPMQFIVSVNGQFNQLPTLEFAPLKPPAWVLAMRNAAERPQRTAPAEQNPA